MREAVIHAGTDGQTRVLIISGSGGKVFCSGIYLMEMGESDDFLSRHEERRTASWAI